MSNLKLLITTDFHADKKALVGLAKRLDEFSYDEVLMLGDLTNPDPKELAYAEAYLDLIDSFQLPLLAIHGNNEPEIVWRLYRERGVSVHLQNRQWHGYNFCGVGGYGYLNENGFEDLSVNNLIINQTTVFLTHVPPRKVEGNVGGPLVHLFGHKHSLAYTKQNGDTLLVQCPAGNLGRLTELELPSKKVSFISML